MNVISDKNEVLNSSVSLQTIDEAFGLVMESRGGAKGKGNERNTDYLIALDVLLKRLRDNGIEKIRVHVVSSLALRIWKPADRIIEIAGSKDIQLKGVNLKELRGRITRVQQEKKKDSKSKGGNPTKRILIEADLDGAAWKHIVLGSAGIAAPVSEEDIDVKSEEFSPDNAEAAKERVSRSVALRRGQPSFRRKLLAAYQNTCAVTGTSFPPILEAAHIVPYMGEKTNHVTNGILLRADIHTLFDLGLLGISQEYKVVVSSSMARTEYEAYNGKEIGLPKAKAEQPSLPALKTRPLPSRH